jgi:hypothetical protein
VAFRYTFSSVFATLIIEAASLTEFWLLPKVWQIVTMYCFCPLILLGINFCGVKVLLIFTLLLEAADC